MVILTVWSLNMGYSWRTTVSCGKGGEATYDQIIGYGSLVLRMVEPKPRLKGEKENKPTFIEDNTSVI